MNAFILAKYQKVHKLFRVQKLAGAAAFSCRDKKLQGQDETAQDVERVGTIK